MATWLQQLGNWNTGATQKIFGAVDDAGNVLREASGFGKAIGGLGINSSNIGGIANTIGQIGTGLLAGQNQTGLGNAMQTIGGLASNIPGVGGLIGAGVGVVGGLINAAFGSNINDEFVSQTENMSRQIGNRIFNSNTNADLLNDWQSAVMQSNVRKSEVGSDGWFSSKASDKTDELNRQIEEANRRQLANFNLAAQNVDANNDLRILQNMSAYGGPINSFRKYYDKGGYLNQAKALIRQNEGWREKPYSDAPKGKNWRSVGYGFNDSGFREKYPEGISKHYEHGITKKQAEEELDYFLNKAEKQLKSIYGKQWNDFTNSQKAAILDTYYQRPASVGKSSRFYKAVTAGEDAGRYLGVAGFDKRNKIRQGVFGGSQDYVNLGAEIENPSTNSSSLQEVTPFTPVVQGLDLSEITPTQAKALELNLTSPTFDLSMFGNAMESPRQVQTPTVGTVEDFLASYGDFEQNLFGGGGKINKYDKPQTFAGRMVEAVGASPSIVRGADVVSSVAQMTPWGYYIAAADLGRDLNRVYHKEKGAKKDAVFDLLSMIPGISAPGLKAAENVWNTIRGNSKIRKALNTGIITGRVADFVDDTYGTDRVSKALGGELNNKDMNIFDFGGGLTHGSDWDTGINWVDEGGSHGENPLGGVPMGVDEQGIPNLVEEGEAIWNGDYVFSKRMKVPKKLREKYHLPDDATFADAVAKLTKSSDERPLSSIDRNTQDYILGEFADTQEEMRMAKAQRAMEKQQQLQDDFLMGMQFGLGGHMSSIGIVPDSDNISMFDRLENAFADGGGIHIDPSKKGTFKAQASKMGMGVQEAASYILANKEDYSPAMVKKANFAKNFAHALGGSLFDNPFGETNIFDFGGDLKTRRNTIMKNSGVTEEQANAMLFRMLSKEDRGRAIKERVFGTWTPTYNSNMEIVVPASTASNRGNVNGGTSQSTSSSEVVSQKFGTRSKTASSVATKPKGATGLNLYDWYRNGSDGISEPTGFKVGQNGKAYDYTQEYKDLVNSLGADDIRKWAAEHPDDSSLKSFLAKGNDLSKLTDDQWRTGATDGKYGFMHHVADSLLGGNDEFEEVVEPALTRAAEDPEWAVDFGDPEVMRNIEAGLNPDGTPASNVGTTRSGFKPKQTWTRQVPIWMSGFFGLKDLLTPADYDNADLVLDAAYRAGQPISVGTEYIGDYRKRNPFDERYLMNIINQRGAAANRNFMNLSGGNRAVAMSGILANDLTTQMSLAEAARQAYLANREDDAKVSEFNRGTNIFNAQAQNTRNLALAQLNSSRQHAMLSGIAQGARLRQAIKDQRDAAISANLSAFAQGLGDLGKENGYYNMLGGLNDEGILKYFYGDNWRTKFNNTQEEV